MKSNVLDFKLKDMIGKKYLFFSIFIFTFKNKFHLGSDLQQTNRNCVDDSMKHILFEQFWNDKESR
jgi:hypothetical protein